MSIRFEIKIDKRDQRKLRKAMERLAGVGRSPRRPLGRIGLFIKRGGQRLLRSRPSDWGPRSGRLSRSLAMILEDSAVTVGSNLVYAAVQQLGHPGIKPKGGRKFLAIPVSPALRRGGVWPRDLPRDAMKYVPNAHITLGRRSWFGPALVRAKTNTPGGTGRQRATRGRHGEVMFALVKQVRIRARPYLIFDSAAQQFALAEFAAEYRRAWKGV